MSEEKKPPQAPSAEELKKATSQLRTVPTPPTGPGPGGTTPPVLQQPVSVDELLKTIGAQTVELGVTRRQLRDMQQALIQLLTEKNSLEAELKELRPKEEGKDPEEKLDPEAEKDPEAKPDLATEKNPEEPVTSD